MRYQLNAALLCLPALLLIGGCLSTGDKLAMPSPEHDGYTLVEQTGQSASGCRFDYRVYRPDTLTTGTSVILGHGFLRDQNNMIGLSRELANTGVQVVTLDFCNMRPWNGHHERNAQDMRALATELGLHNDVIYAGFSAGGLAAVLAADNDTRAILTLDLVDQNNLGVQAIKALEVPLIGLSGPASGCNAQGNGQAVFDARPAALYSDMSEVDGASHCEFETPSNWLCEIACGDDGDTEADDLETDIIVRLIVRKLTPYLTSPQG